MYFYISRMNHYIIEESYAVSTDNSHHTRSLNLLFYNYFVQYNLFDVDYWEGGWYSRRRVNMRKCFSLQAHKIYTSHRMYVNITSFHCFLQIIYNLIATKAARQLLHNHAVIVMLVFNWIQLDIDLSMTINF